MKWSAMKFDMSSLIIFQRVSELRKGKRASSACSAASATLFTSWIGTHMSCIQGLSPLDFLLGGASCRFHQADLPTRPFPNSQGRQAMPSTRRKMTSLMLTRCRSVSDSRPLMGDVRSKTSDCLLRGTSPLSRLFLFPILLFLLLLLLLVLPPAAAAASRGCR